MLERPDVLPSRTHKIRTGCEEIFVIVSFYEDRPFEVFLSGAGAGCCQHSQNEAVGRLVSLAMRSNIELPDIIKQISGIHCENASVVGRSCPDAVAEVLRTYLPKPENNS